MNANTVFFARGDQEEKRGSRARRIVQRAQQVRRERKINWLKVYAE
jgi:hypothetical protein